MKITFHLLLVRAPPDGYLPALDDSLDSYEGSGGEESSGEGGGRAAGEGEAGLDDLGDIDADLGDLGDLDDVDYLDDLGDVNADLVEAGLDGYEGSGQDDGAIQFDLPEYDEDNLVEAESTTENPTEQATEPIENNLVEEEEDPTLKTADETYTAPGPDIPEGDPANLPDVPPGPKV